MQQVLFKKRLVPSSEHGMALIEVLISIFLMAIIGLGAAFIAARTAVVHRNENIHLLTVNQMRLKLESEVACDNNTNISIKTQTVNTPCSTSTFGYTVAAFKGDKTGHSSSANGGISITSPHIQVASDDTFVPVKVEISP
ncbi:PulJ/GspJ family protein [Acinetobacter sp. CAAS 2-6]|uniref:PulJ/GspJ family protein n=1 Tax=Acinetobacter sp. CAAS 2-6 TaxID=3016358 RepID=UPI002DD6A5D6|nr:prepilin-type N-terminal cleavage/methylation domain-containing protein [Acinetobacter sp. CAAS 2-6]